MKFMSDITFGLLLVVTLLNILVWSLLSYESGMTVNWMFTGLGGLMWIAGFLYLYTGSRKEKKENKKLDEFDKEEEEE